MAGGNAREARRASFKVALRHSIALIVCLMIVGGAVGGFAGWNRDRYSTASATILVNPLDGNPYSTTGSGDSLDNLETEAQLVRSFEVAEMVKTKLGSTTEPADLLNKLNVTVPTNTQLMVITCADRDAVAATECAQAFSAEFLAFREGRARSLSASQVKLINQSIANLVKEQTKVASQLQVAGSANAKASLQSQLEALTAQINQLRSRSAGLQIGPFDPGQVVTPAALQNEGLLQSRAAFAVASVLGGLLLGLAIVFIRSRMDDRIHHIDDVTLAGRTLIGQVDRADVRSLAGELAGGSTAVAVPESFRGLAAGLLTSIRKSPSVVLVTAGDDQHAPVPESAVGLALALSAARHKTVVVDAVGIFAFLRRETEYGLPTLDQVLDNGGSPDNALESVTPYLQVIHTKSDVEFDDLLMSPAMGVLVAHLRRQADIVLIVSKAITGPAPQALADLADVAASEITEGVSSYEDALADARAPRSRDLGVVYISAVKRKRARRRRRPGDHQAPDSAPSQPEAGFRERRSLTGSDVTGPRAVGMAEQLSTAPSNEVDSARNDPTADPAQPAEPERSGRSVD